MSGYQICARCIMDSSDHDITFNAVGVCNHCTGYDRAMIRLGSPAKRDIDLKRLVAKIKARSVRQDFNCLLGLSGGVDSSYAAVVLKDLGLRVLAVHLDSGWNTEVAVRNIERTVKALDIELLTYVIDWEAMRDLQVAFFKASVANADIPQDHAIVASLYRIALKENIKYIITGTNVATESVEPRSWGHSYRDLRHLRAIHKRFGTKPLGNYPTLGLLYDVLYCRGVKGIRKVEILNYIPYRRDEAVERIQKALGWKDYGGKHYESGFTRFFQSYYLPVRFGFDKKRAHLSSLILSGEISRADALSEMSQSSSHQTTLQREALYVLQKLGLSEAEFTALMASPIRSYRDYPSSARTLKTLVAIKQMLTPA